MIQILKTTNFPSLLIRLPVGVVFLSEGIQKFLFPEILGTDRFQLLGFSHAAFWADFTGFFEIICAVLILLGLFTRLAAIPLLIIMIVAFITTKYPELSEKGFWLTLHDYRTDFAMTLLLIFLLKYGAGNYSLDKYIRRDKQTK
jgi:putative oxidoreductase